MTITLNSIISGNFDGPISVVGPQGPAGSSGSNGTQGAQGAAGISAVIYDGGLVRTSSPGGSAKGTGTSASGVISDAKKNFIAQNYDSSNSEIYLVSAQAIGGTTSLWIDMQWREIY